MLVRGWYKVAGIFMILASPSRSCLYTFIKHVFFYVLNHQSAIMIVHKYNFASNSGSYFPA